MRLNLLAAGLLAALSLAGCKPMPKEQATKAFQKELHLYFNNLNNEAQARKDDLRKAGTSWMAGAPSGTIYSTYFFDEAGSIVFDGNGAPQDPNAGEAVRAAAEKLPGATIRPMFQIKTESPGRLVAVVRAIRRQWAYDLRGTVTLSPKAMEKASSDPTMMTTWLPSESGTDKYNHPGLHRLDASFADEFEFEYRGGDMTLLSRKREEPVRPWTAIRVESAAPKGMAPEKK
jgi:hypothetical protein